MSAGGAAGGDDVGGSRRMRGWAGGLAVLAALAAGGTAWESAAERHDRRALPPRGGFVEVGGRRIHLLALGRSRPGPTVILEAGIGGATLASWGRVEPAVAAFAPVVAYDRGGLGWSDPGPEPRDAVRLTQELHAALRAAGIGPPYVLVGHSYGGLLARMFAHRHPDEVAGLVLVESSYPVDPATRSRLRSWRRAVARLLPALPTLARVGLVRAALPLLPTNIRALPPLERAEQSAFYARPSHWRGVLAEFDAWETLTDPEVAALGGLDDRPLFVLTAGSGARWPGWLRLQERNAALSSDSVHEVVPGADHAGLIEDARWAPRVVEAIGAVVESARSGRPLRSLVRPRPTGPPPPRAGS